MPDNLTGLCAGGILAVMILRMVFEFITQQGRKKHSPHGWTSPNEVHRGCDRLEGKLDRIVTATENTVTMIGVLQKGIDKVANSRPKSKH